MFDNTKKVLDLIIKEYIKEQNETNTSNANDFLDEIVQGINELRNNKIKQ